MDTEYVLDLARKNLGGEMGSSARLALTDAVKLFYASKLDDAQRRALRSLQHSVGIFHPDFIKASKWAP